MLSRPGPVVAALAVVVSARGVLLVRRHDRIPPVALPGGRCEAGETAAAAAAREILEECGVAVEAVRELAHLVHPVTGAVLIYVVCTARIAGRAADTGARRGRRRRLVAARGGARRHARPPPAGA